MTARSRKSVAAFLCLFILHGCGGGDSGRSGGEHASTVADGPSDGVTLASATDVEDGDTVGALEPGWQNGPTSSGGRGPAVAGMTCTPTGASYGYVHLAIVHNGKNVALPADIGVVGPTTVAQRGCVYPVHTRDASGKLHVDLSVPLNLGQFFAVWGMPLTSSNVAGFAGEAVKVYTNDGGNLAEYKGDLSALQLLQQREITIVLGTSLSQLPTYHWQNPPPLSDTPITLWLDNTIGNLNWPDGDATAGGHGATTRDGITCESNMSDNYHVHAHVAIIRDGQMLALPQSIGLPGKCYYEMHTHDRTGTVHIEALGFKRFTLGNFFSVWGQPLSWTNVAGITGKPVAIYLNDNGDIWQYKGDPANIDMISHRSITIQIGARIGAIPTYSWGSSMY